MNQQIQIQLKTSNCRFNRQKKNTIEYNRPQATVIINLGLFKITK